VDQNNREIEIQEGKKKLLTPKSRQSLGILFPQILKLAEKNDIE